MSFSATHAICWNIGRQWDARFVPICWGENGFLRRSASCDFKTGFISPRAGSTFHLSSSSLGLKLPLPLDEVLAKVKLIFCLFSQFAKKSRSILVWNFRWLPTVEHMVQTIPIRCPDSFFKMYPLGPKVQAAWFAFLSAMPVCYNHPLRRFLTIPLQMDKWQPLRDNVSVLE